MATRGRAFHEEVSRKRGHFHRLLLPDAEPTWRGRQQRYKVPSSIAKLYPDNAGLAAAVGLGKEGEHAPGTKAYARRQGFMGQARRWRSGKRQGKPVTPDKARVWGPRLRSAGRSAQRKIATPNTDRDVLDLMVNYGVTVVRVAGVTGYDERDRDIRRSVFITPGTLAHSFDGLPSFAELAGGSRLTWGGLAEAFLSAWSFAYTGSEATFGGDQFDNLDAVTFRLGRPPAVDYEASVAA